MQVHHPIPTRSMQTHAVPEVPSARYMPDDGDDAGSEPAPLTPSGSLVWGGIALAIGLLCAGVFLQT